MDINEFKPNSDVYKKSNLSPKERPKAVVPSGSVRTKKRSFFNKLIFSLLSDDVDSVGESLLSEFVIPGIRDFIADGLEMLIRLAFYGRDARKKGKSGETYISYNNYSSGHSRNRAAVNTGYIFDEDLIFEPTEKYTGKEIADFVIDGMYEALASYNEVTVRDFYDLCGKTSPNEAADQYKGWKDLRGTYAIPIGGGRARLNLPRYQDLK